MAIVYFAESINRVAGEDCEPYPYPYPHPYQPLPLPVPVPVYPYPYPKRYPNQATTGRLTPTLTLTLTLTRTRTLSLSLTLTLARRALAELRWPAVLRQAGRLRVGARHPSSLSAPLPAPLPNLSHSIQCGTC